MNFTQSGDVAVNVDVAVSVDSAVYVAVALSVYVVFFFMMLMRFFLKKHQTKMKLEISFKLLEHKNNGSADQNSKIGGYN